MFDDRKDAGEKLGRALHKYKNKGVLVLGIPRGGVLVAYQVAKCLHGDLSLIVSRKLPFPDNPEAGFGAVAEDGSTFLFEDAETWLPQVTINRILREQQKEAERRVTVLRKGRPLPPIGGRTVILVDDGIAMGSTMRAAIQTCRNQKAGKIVVGAPVAGPDVAKEIARMVDELVVLEKPPFFRAVAQVYRYWYDVPDEEVIEILDRWEKEHSPAQW
jgi:predicted phosphoribosyltransferase